MPVKIRLVFCLYLFCTLVAAYPAQSVDFDDDISFSWFSRDKKAKSKKEKANKDTPNKKENTKDKLSEGHPQDEKTAEKIEKVLPAAKKILSGLSSANDHSEQTASDDTSQVYSGNLLKKVRLGLKFSSQEMENWIASTTDINACHENGQTMLLYLVKKYKDVQSLLMLIENGADIQTHCTPRQEALFVAAANNPSAAITEALLNNGANFAERDSENNTALIIAAAFNPSSKVLDTLIDFGLKPNAINKYGYNALILSAYENGRLSVLQTLIDNGANPNFRDPQGHTPIMAAAIRGRDKAMKYLIKRGANYRATDKQGISVLDYYHKRQYLQMFNFPSDEYKTISERMLHEFNFIAENHLRYNNALKQSIYKDNPEEAVADALQKLADVDVLDEEKCTPLLNAARNNNSLLVLEHLINANANPNAKCLGGKNALMILAQNATSANDVSAQITKAQYLTRNGLNINATDTDGNTALMYAIQNNADKNFIATLLEAGAAVNQNNHEAKTALWLAIRKQLPAEIIDMLIEYGADTNEVDNTNETPLWYQLQNEGNDDITLALLKGGADVNTQNTTGDYPLWYAFNRDFSVDIIEGIIKKQKDLNIKNENGDTPLLFAVKHDYPASTIKLLIKGGANPNIPDINGYTIYDIIESDLFYDETVKKVNHDKAISGW